MTFDLQKMIESKRALRRELAARPVAEKLRMLDALRERALALRQVPQGGMRPASDDHSSNFRLAANPEGIV